jgi:hypothetical protein
MQDPDAIRLELTELADLDPMLALRVVAERLVDAEQLTSIRDAAAPGRAARWVCLQPAHASR